MLCLRGFQKDMWNTKDEVITRFRLLSLPPLLPPRSSFSPQVLLPLLSTSFPPSLRLSRRFSARILSSRNGPLSLFQSLPFFSLFISSSTQQRSDAWASTFEHLLEKLSSPRVDCPTTLPNAAPVSNEELAAVPPFTTPSLAPLRSQARNYLSP